MKITFVDHLGAEREIEALTGSTVMDVAVGNAVPGIDADCGGACSCATCHVYVDELWFERTGPAGPMEQAMLDFADKVRETSRLSCQIKLEPVLDGLRVATPETQG
ncbi:2Fe-2S iron-sulfur cluster-binding protein [soil metagenome]